MTGAHGTTNSWVGLPDHGLVGQAHRTTTVCSVCAVDALDARSLPLRLWCTVASKWDHSPWPWGRGSCKHSRVLATVVDDDSSLLKTHALCRATFAVIGHAATWHVSGSTPPRLPPGHALAPPWVTWAAGAGAGARGLGAMAGGLAVWGVGGGHFGVLPVPGGPWAHWQRETPAGAATAHPGPGRGRSTHIK